MRKYVVFINPPMQTQKRTEMTQITPYYIVEDKENNESRTQLTRWYM